MSAYETSATVEEHGQVHVTGVPFDLGTRVDVVVIPKIDEEQAGKNELSAGRLTQLLAALDKARNLKPVGALRRDELYDRNGLH